MLPAGLLKYSQDLRGIGGIGSRQWPITSVVLIADHQGISSSGGCFKLLNGIFYAGNLARVIEHPYRQILKQRWWHRFNY